MKGDGAGRVSEMTPANRWARIVLEHVPLPRAGHPRHLQRLRGVSRASISTPSREVQSPGAPYLHLCTLAVLFSISELPREGATEAGEAANAAGEDAVRHRRRGALSLARRYGYGMIWLDLASRDGSRNWRAGTSGNVVRQVLRR